MKVGILKERDAGERRVALVPVHVLDLIKLNFSVFIEKGAGSFSGFKDEEYVSKGAKVLSSCDEVIKECDILLAVNQGAASSYGEEVASKMKGGQLVIANLSPYKKAKVFDIYNQNKVSSFSMELIPRTTKAQSMDVLSSMANLAGYKAVLLGANLLNRIFPMMMTAAGTIPAAKVFIIGVGVAGLQAIATAKRLGALVHAYDVRSAVKEQVLSLGAKFVEMDLEKGDGAGGYAKEMNEEFYKKQRELMKTTLKDSDLVITTAAIPGKPSPILITSEMLSVMKPGSVIIDLAAERGGNCEGTKLGEVVEYNEVKIFGPKDISSSLNGNSSTLYSKNLINFLKNMVNKEKVFSINREEEIVAGTLVTYQGEVVNSQVKSWFN